MTRKKKYRIKEIKDRVGGFIVDVEVEGEENITRINFDDEMTEDERWLGELKRIMNEKLRDKQKRKKVDFKKYVGRGFDIDEMSEAKSVRWKL